MWLEWLSDFPNVTELAPTAYTGHIGAYAVMALPWGG